MVPWWNSFNDFMLSRDLELPFVTEDSVLWLEPTFCYDDDRDERQIFHTMTVEGLVCPHPITKCEDPYCWGFYGPDGWEVATRKQTFAIPGGVPIAKVEEWEALGAPVEFVESHLKRWEEARGVQG